MYNITIHNNTQKIFMIKKYNKDKIKWDKLYKKKVDYLEKTLNSKWEIQEVKEKSHTIEINSNFTKFFWISTTRLIKLNKQELAVLLIILDNIQYWNDVFIHDIMRVKIFPKNNARRIQNSLTNLFKQSILYKTDLKWLYKFNHEMAFKWDSRAYKKLLWLDESVWKNMNYRLENK